LFSSYGADLSSDASVKRRTLIQSDWFRERWGHLFELCGDQNVKTHFENTRTGAMQATSTGGAVTGKGGHRVVIDDPTKTQEGKQDENLPLALKTDIDFYRDTLSTTTCAATWTRRSQDAGSRSACAERPRKTSA